MERKKRVYDLLKGIESGDPESVKVVNENRYIQHNPQTHEGGEGLAQLFARLAKTNPKVTIARLFEDGDFVFGHTVYDFSTVRIGFEVFRFEGDYIVEHWDNIQARNGDMISGSTEVKDVECTEKNRAFIKAFLSETCLEKNHETLPEFIGDNYIEHSTFMPLHEKLQKMKLIRLVMYRRWLIPVL